MKKEAADICTTSNSSINRKHYPMFFYSSDVLQNKFSTALFASTIKKIISTIEVFDRSKVINTLDWVNRWKHIITMAGLPSRKAIAYILLVNYLLSYKLFFDRNKYKLVRTFKSIC